jgi:2-polyprenyl-3-methyl-5-hydroxy-6-metoxy-1,4-benzoquinol methylase
MTDRTGPAATDATSGEATPAESARAGRRPVDGSPRPADRAHDYSASYDPETDFDRWYTLATAQRIATRIRPGDRVLELGCATGLMTARLVAAGAVVVGVERSAQYLDRARRRNLPGATFVAGDVESHRDAGSYRHVLATNLLHEVADPEGLLRRMAELAAPDGFLHVTLQNPASLHRLVAVATGLLGDLSAVSDRGTAYGTQRLWTAGQLVGLCEAAGLEVVERTGIMLKPYPNAVMASLPEPVTAALAALGDTFPDHSAMTYVVARPRGASR